MVQNDHSLDFICQKATAEINVLRGNVWGHLTLTYQKGKWLKLRKSRVKTDPSRDSRSHDEQTKLFFSFNFQQLDWIAASPFITNQEALSCRPLTWNSLCS